MPDAPNNATQDPNELVCVFTTDDPGALPLAQVTLDAEDIAYIVRHPGRADSMDWTRSQTPTSEPVHASIFVAGDVAARARDLLVDLEQAAGGADPVGLALFGDSVTPRAMHLENASTGASLGEITEAQLQDLMGRLEPEQRDSGEFLIDQAGFESLQDAGVDPALLDLLRPAVEAAGDAGLVIRWSVR